MKKLGILALGMVFVFGMSLGVIAQTTSTNTQKVLAQVTEETYLQMDSVDFGVVTTTDEGTTKTFPVSGNLVGVGGNVYLYVNEAADITTTNANGLKVSVSVTNNNITTTVDLVNSNSPVSVTEHIAADGDLKTTTASAIEGTVTLDVIPDVGTTGEVSIIYTLSDQLNQLY